MTDSNKENIEETLTRIALKIAKSGKGCIFVIMNNKFDYAPLIEQDIKPFSVYENQRRTEILGLNDGACIISPEGNLIAYSINILNVKTFTGFGLRHSSSYTASFNGNTVILASEEDQKVRIFKDGKYIMQIDALEKNIEGKIKEAKIKSILESVGVGALGGFGIVLLAPTVGVSLIPGILIFGSAHFTFKLIGNLLDKSKKE